VIKSNLFVQSMTTFNFCYSYQQLFKTLNVADKM